MTKEERAERVHIDDLHFEHQQWVRELKFYKQEMGFFKDRLEEVAARYTSMDVMKDLEKFQNQMYIQGNAIDELIHDVNSHESEIAQYAKEHPVAIEHVLFKDHSPLRERIETNRDIVNQFKKEYHRFLAKWM